MFKTEEILATKSAKDTKIIKQKRTKIPSCEWSVVRKYVSRKGAKTHKKLATEVAENSEKDI